MLVPRAYCLMMRTQVVFTLVVHQVLLTRVPLDTVSIFCYFVKYPKIPYFHRLQMLPFDGVFCDTNGSGVVPMDLCFWSRVAPFFQCHSKYHAFFAVQKQGSEFGFYSGRNNKAKYGTQGKESCRKYCCHQPKYTCTWASGNSSQWQQYLQ